MQIYFWNAALLYLIIGKYPFVRCASTCKDSSLTGKGSTYGSSLPNTVSGVDWGKIFLIHSLTTHEMSLAWACSSWSEKTGVWIPEELVDFLGDASPGYSWNAPPGEAGNGLPLLKLKSCGSFILGPCALAEAGGLGGCTIWHTSIRGGCILAIEPKQVRQATRTFGSETENSSEVAITDTFLPWNRKSIF